MHDINPAMAGTVSNFMAQLGAHIRRGRKEGLRENRETFAKRIGCAPMTLDRIERGEPGVAVVYVAAALQALQVLHDVVQAASPDVLIATQVPPDFPAEFGSLD